MILHLAVLVQYRRVTDGWTVRQHTMTAYTVLAQRRTVKITACEAVLGEPSSHSRNVKQLTAGRPELLQQFARLK